MKTYLEQINKGIIDLEQDDSGNAISIIIAGDMCLDRRIEELSKKDKFDQIYNNVTSELDNKDLSIVNLECPITNRTNPIDKTGPKLKAGPETIQNLTYGLFDVATLANNHILDQGEHGLIETMGYLSGAGIKTVGAGKNLKEASKFLTLDIKNNKIAILNFTENEFSIAKKNNAGANPLNTVKNYYDIEAAKKKADIILVIVHGGVERYRLPSPNFKEILHFYADLGATAVIAHHSHCASGLEIHNNVPIIYSLGNFLFDRDYDYPYWFKSFFIRLFVNGNNVKKVQLVPYYQFQGGIGMRLMNKIEGEQFLNEIADLSRIILNEELLYKEWDKLCSKKSIRYLSIICSLNMLQKKILRKGICSSMILKKEKLLPLLNMFRCQSHREVMKNVIQNELDRK